MTRQTHIVVIASLIYMLVAGGVLSFAVYKVTTLGHQLSERTTAIADKNAKVKVYKKLSNLINETVHEREELRSFLLTEEQTSIFLTDVENIARSQGVTLSTNSLKVVQQEESFDQLIIQFELEGRTDNVKKMLMVLETLPYNSHISSLSFVRSSENATKGTIELTVTLQKNEK